MNFYENWESVIDNDTKNETHICRFLSKDEDSLDVFKKGTIEELVYVCNLLLSIPINTFIECINEEKHYTSDMIFQYSTLEHAIVDVCNVLKFIGDGLTFSELGKIIIKAKEDGACKKYGENHSKLAEEMSMVSLERIGVTKVYLTSFGDFSVCLSSKDRMELIRRLSLRNYFVQDLIFQAKNNYIVSYMDMAQKTLSKSTAIRRKSNVRQIVDLILKDDIELLNKIVW